MQCARRNGGPPPRQHTRFADDDIYLDGGPDQRRYVLGLLCAAPESKKAVLSLPARQLLLKHTRLKLPPHCVLQSFTLLSTGGKQSLGMGARTSLLWVAQSVRLASGAHNMGAGSGMLQPYMVCSSTAN